MSSMNISIRKAVYDELRRRRAPGESFSDAIERLLHRPTKPSDFFGILHALPSSAWRGFEADRRRQRRLDAGRERRLRRLLEG